MKELDIIGLLPLEVSQKILGYLTSEALGTCSKVCKKWWEIANFGLLWKEHCLKYDLSEEESEDRDNSGPLVFSSWAANFCAFRNSPAYNWYNNLYQVVPSDAVEHKYTAFGFCENYFAGYSDSSYKLDVFKINKCRNCSANIELLYSIPICFPKRRGRKSIKNSKKVMVRIAEGQIVVAKCNIALVFIWENDCFELFKAIRITSAQEFVTENINDYVQQNFDHSYESDLYDVVNSFLLIGWMSCNIYSINIYTNDVKYIPGGDKNSMDGNYVVTYNVRPRSKIIYDKSGYPLLQIPMREVKEVQLNDKVYCMLMRDLRIKVKDLCTRDILLDEPVPLGTEWIKVHSQHEIVYTLLTTSKQYLITCWDVRAREKLWVCDYPLTEDTHKAPFWTLIEVCGKYLISWPLPFSAGNYLCINSRTGKLIYQAELKSVDTESKVSVLNDKVWFLLSNEGCEIALRSYM